MPYLRLLFALIALFNSALPAVAAELGTPQLLADPTLQRSFAPGRLVVEGEGTRFSLGDFTVSPRVGLGYESWERSLQSGYGEALQQIHAEAGGTIELARGVSLTAAAKLPFYTHDSVAGYTAGSGTLLPSRLPGGEFSTFRINQDTLSWRSEVGFQLNREMDLGIYYDESVLSGPPGGFTGTQQERRFGTHFNIRFK